MRSFLQEVPGVQPMRVLIVEDQALVAMEIEGMLGLAGHEAIAQADDFRSAIAAVDAEQPDIALVDIQLAEGDSGLDVAVELKKRGIPVLFATGNCPAERGRELAIGCLHKPITDQTLAAALKAVSAVISGAQPPSLPSSIHLYI